MFEVGVIRDPLSINSSGETTTLGALAETLLFYGQTHLVFGPSSLSSLIGQIGYPTFERLLDEGYIKATYIDEMEMIAHRTGDGPDGLFSFGTASGSTEKRQSWRDRISPLLIAAGVDEGKARKTAERLLGSMKLSRLSSGLPGGARVGDLFIEQIRKFPDMTSQAVSFAQSQLPSGKAPNIGKYQIVEERPGYFRAIGDSGWQEAMSLLDQSTEHGSANRRVALASYAAFADFVIASRFHGDLIGTPLKEAMVLDLVGVAMHRRLANADQIAQFNRVELGEGYGVAEAIDSGERSFTEFMGVLDKSRKFRGSYGRKLVTV